MPEHDDLTGIEIHVPHSYEYANATDRENATGFLVGDVKKLALQSDDSSLWILINHSPVTWEPVSKGVPTLNQDITNHTDVATAYVHATTVSGNPHDLDKGDVGLANVPNVDCTNASNITTGTLPTSVLPPLAITSTYVVNSEAAQLALTVQEGDVAIRSDEPASYIHNGGSAGDMTDWTEFQAPTDAVLSVNAKTGTVVLTQDDIGNGTTYVRTTNDFTDTLKTKLDGVADSANNYTHPTTAGNKHIPSGGASGNLLYYDSDGTAVWAGPGSHTHDARYYTETEADANFLGKTAKASDSSALNAASDNEGAVASTIMKRNSNADAFARYYNTSASAQATSPSHFFVEIGSDGYIRKQTLANVKSNLGINALAPLASPTFTGTVTAPTFNTNSSRTKKENIEDFKESAIEILKQVDVVSYNYIEDEDKTPKVGFIAEDTDTILSTPNQDKMDLSNSIGLLIKATQELVKRIEDLEKSL